VGEGEGKRGKEGSRKVNFVELNIDESQMRGRRKEKGGENPSRY